MKGLLERGGVDELIVVTDNEPLSEFTDTFLLCEELGVTARVVLNFFPHSFARTELERFGEFPLLSFSTTPTNEALLFVRRIMDLAIVCICRHTYTACYRHQFYSYQVDISRSSLLQAGTVRPERQALYHVQAEVHGG